jgi:hypothetical protein
MTITITHPTPGTQRDMDAVKSVLIAADPYWAADYSSENSPGRVVLTIGAAGWHVVAGAIADAERAGGPGWSTSITSTPPLAGFEPMFARSFDGQGRG